MRKLLEAIAVLVIATACAEGRRPESPADLIDEYFAAYDQEDSATMTSLRGWPASNGSRIGQQLELRRKYRVVLHREPPFEYQAPDTTDAGIVRHYRVPFELRSVIATGIFAVRTGGESEKCQIVESRLNVSEKEPRERDER